MITNKTCCGVFNAHARNPLNVFGGPQDKRTRLMGQFTFTSNVTRTYNNLATITNTTIVESNQIIWVVRKCHLKDIRKISLKRPFKSVNISASQSCFLSRCIKKVDLKFGLQLLYNISAVGGSIIIFKTANVRWSENTLRNSLSMFSDSLKVGMMIIPSAMGKLCSKVLFFNDRPMHEALNSR